ncbi:MAG: undecaprenyl-diphosphate phosphatase [Clostridia bacterium]|nr:undecaprenyl-diphosphate phosphatase [Clostridia bacterium]
MKILEFIKAIILGIVEGITEWLPVSSTGHLILLDEFLTLGVSDEFMNLFLVVIQLGASLAVAVLFFSKLNPFSRRKTVQERRATWSLWGKVVVGMLPAALIGIPLDDLLEEHLYRYEIVAAALIVYGIAFIVIEKRRRNTAFRVERVEDLSYVDALKIGCFQVLSLIPGTSRSGSTILGGMLTGVSRTASAEFSFFMAIPVMLGASLLKIAKFVLDGFTASPLELGLLAVGTVVSFVVSLCTIRFLMDFVKRHDFKPFGIYRIALGILVLIVFLVRTVA